MFEAYMNNLIVKMRAKYPGKDLIFVLDNLASHKSSLIMKIMENEDNCFMLPTPSCSP